MSDAADTKRTHPTRVVLSAAIVVMTAFTIYQASQLGGIPGTPFESEVTGSVESFP